MSCLLNSAGLRGHTARSEKSWSWAQQQLCWFCGVKPFGRVDGGAVWINVPRLQKSWSVCTLGTTQRP